MRYVLLVAVMVATIFTAALSATATHAAIAPVVCYSCDGGGGQPACGYGVGSWTSSSGVTYYCIFDSYQFRWRWVTL